MNGIAEMSVLSLRWIFVLCVGVSVDVLAQDFEGGAPRDSAPPRRQTGAFVYAYVDADDGVRGAVITTANGEFPHTNYIASTESA